MRLTRVTLVAGAALALGLTAAAAGPARAAQADQAFVEEAASGGRMEVELGRYATQHAKDPQVKKFGQRMVDDHGKVNAELSRVAQKESITLPAKLAEKHEESVTRLTALKGAEFDREYMKAMVDDHEEDVAKFRDVAQSAGTPQVKAFAQKTLPTLEEHLRMAKDIQARMEKRAAR